MQACQRYGFDSPFPFMHGCFKLKKANEEEENTETRKQQDTGSSEKMMQREERGNFPVITTVDDE